jgi:hypothetical protein
MSGLPELKRPRGGLELRRRSLSRTTPLAGIITMTRKLARHRRARNDGGVPLFDWADAQRRQPGRTPAARHIQRRFGFDGPTAALYASLAGFPGEGE